MRLHHLSHLQPSSQFFHYFEVFVYNLIYDDPQNNMNKRWLEIAIYLYTEIYVDTELDNQTIKITSIDITNPIIAKSFGTSIDEEELDDVLTKTEFATNTKWVKNIEVNVHEPSPKGAAPTNKSETYIHYKRIR